MTGLFNPQGYGTQYTLDYTQYILLPFSTNFKNSYKLNKTCYAAGTCTVALSTSYSINLFYEPGIVMQVNYVSSVI